MTEEHYRKVITKDTDLWDRVYRFDLIKVLLAKTELKDTISFMEMFLTSEPNSFGAILYQWFDGLVQRIKLLETITPSKLPKPGNTNTYAHPRHFLNAWDQI